MNINEMTRRLAIGETHGIRTLDLGDLRRSYCVIIRNSFALHDFTFVRASMIHEVNKIEDFLKTRGAEYHDTYIPAEQGDRLETLREMDKAIATCGGVYIDADTFNVIRDHKHLIETMLGVYNAMAVAARGNDMLTFVAQTANQRYECLIRISTIINREGRTHKGLEAKK